MPLIRLFRENRPHIAIPRAVITGQQAVCRGEAGGCDMVEFGEVAGLVVAFPRETVRLWELAQDGRWAEARKLYEWFLPLLHLDIGPKFVQQIKLVEALMGVGSARVRAPRLQLTEAEASAVEKILEDALEKRPEV